MKKMIDYQKAIHVDLKKKYGGNVKMGIYLMLQLDLELCQAQVADIVIMREKRYLNNRYLLLCYNEVGEYV